MPLIRSIRNLLARLDEKLSHLDVEKPAESVPPPARYEEIVRFVRSIDLPDAAAREYLEIHISRIARTLTLVPPPRGSKRVLELGAYMQMTPALQCVLGYQEVRGAYFGPLGRTDKKAVTVRGQEVFRCFIDLFDAEKDRYPYQNERFETVLACEIFEHMLHDPMHMLIELHRVLDEGGTLILTTPNVASYLAVARVLEQSGNPQIFSKFAYPLGEFADTEIPHVREYTPAELREAVESAGFRGGKSVHRSDPRVRHGSLGEGFPGAKPVLLRAAWRAVVLHREETRRTEGGAVSALSL
jgi:SAM-dependent methyltransferase